MKARVTHEFKGVPDGEVMTRVLRVGMIIAGSLAAAAVEAGTAVALGEDGKPLQPDKAAQEAAGAAGDGQGGQEGAGQPEAGQDAAGAAQGSEEGNAEAGSQASQAAGQEEQKPSGKGKGGKGR